MSTAILKMTTDKTSQLFISRPYYRRKKKHQKSSIWKKILIIVFSLVLILVIAGGIVFAKLYHDVAKSADATYAKVERTKTSAGREAEVDLSKKEPFSVLMLGVDTGALGRTYKGRSDSMMVATVNPHDQKTTLVSLERDTYATIVGHDGTEDKINHAYAFGGAGMSMDTVSNLLDIPIDHYIVINMEGKEDETISIKHMQEKITHITKKNGHSPQISTCLIGWLDGKLMDGECRETLTRAFMVIDAMIIDQLDAGNFSSYTGFTPNVSDWLQVGDKKINLNIAIRYSQYDNRTYVTIASPIITQEY